MSRYHLTIFICGSNKKLKSVWHSFSHLSCRTTNSSVVVIVIILVKWNKKDTLFCGVLVGWLVGWLVGCCFFVVVFCCCFLWGDGGVADRVQCISSKVCWFIYVHLCRSLLSWISGDGVCLHCGTHILLPAANKHAMLGFPDSRANTTEPENGSL